MQQARFNCIGLRENQFAKCRIKKMCRNLIFISITRNSVQETIQKQMRKQTERKLIQK